MSDFHTPVHFQLVFALRLRPGPSSVIISSADEPMTDRLQLVYLFKRGGFSMLDTSDQWNSKYYPSCSRGNTPDFEAG